MTSNAEIAKAVLKIQHRDGVCTPRAFVAEAAKKSSPLHDLFSWDDATEAQLWREHYARICIGRVKVTVHDEDRVPAHVHVTITQNNKHVDGYVPITVAMDDVDMRAQVFREAKAGLNGWRKRLITFDEASGAVELLRQAIDALNKLT